MAKNGKGALTREDILEQALEDIKGKFGDGAIMRLGENLGSRLDMADPIDGINRRENPPLATTLLAVETQLG